MSLLNVSLNVVCYADEPKSVNPQVKFADLKWSMLGLPTDTPKELPISLSPGESKQIMSTARAISYTGITSFEIEQVTGTDYSRLIGTYGARTARPDGDATTEWALTRTNKLVKLQYTGTGTAPTFGSMAPGDGITIDDAAFNPLNRGDFTIVSVGVNYVEFVNEIASNETIVAQVEIYSSGPVQIGDTLDLTATAFSFPNRGQFEVLRVTDQYVEFANPDAVPEAGIVGVTSGLSIYLDAFNWVLLAVNRRVIVKCNGDTQTGSEVEPPTDGDIVKFPGLLLKRGKLFQLDLTNPGLESVSGVVLLAE